MGINLKSPFMVHVLFFVLLLIIIGTEFAYRPALYDKSIEIQRFLQDNHTKGWTVFFRIPTEWGTGYVYAVVIAFILNWESSGRSLYYITFLSLLIYINNITKMAYHEPRPWMVDDDLKQIPACSKQYGNASGHSIMASGFHIFLFLDVYANTTLNTTR